jgi:hypothetical protein
MDRIKMKKHFKWQAWFVFIFILVSAEESVWAANQRYLSDVVVQAAIANPMRGESASVSWRNHIGGKLDLLICDMDGFVVRHLLNQADKTAGTHTATWDGRDDQGQPLPNGAYFPFIIITTDRQSRQIYDPTQTRWGYDLPEQNLTYVPEQQQITYRLEKKALCLVRIGEKEGGPCYGTLLQWEPRMAGKHSEPWDGKDAQGLASVYMRKHFDFVFNTLALPDNALLLQGSAARYVRRNSNTERMALHPPTGKDIYMHSLHPRYLCQDPQIRVNSVSGLKMKSKKTLLAHGDVIGFAIAVADPQQAANLLKEGCEVYSFIDGHFNQEIKIDRLPATIDVPIQAISAGTHIVTFNLRTIEDHVGSFSVQIEKK